MRGWLGLAAATTLALAGAATAADKTWDNGSGNFTWNTTSTNWTGAVWSNAAGDGAIFGATGAGTISVPAGIAVNSINFAADEYVLNGAGPLTFVNGTSTQTTGVVNVTAGATAIVDVPLTSSVTAIQKIGAGVLQLSQPLNVTASFPMTGNGSLSANLIIGPAPTGTSPIGGTVRVMNASVLPSTIKVGLGAGGVLDIGPNNVTIGELQFTNQNQGINYPAYGVNGTGTLRVTGEINVIGMGSSNFGNAINTPLDLGGGTQIVRSSAITFFSGPANLIFAGPISNGSLLKTLGYRDNGTFGGGDGIALTANNTYTGSTVINTGTLGNSLASGTNASTSLKVVNASMSLLGADGSYGSAATVQILSGAGLTLDNSTGTGTFGGGSGIPLVAAANNPNRLADSAAVTMRDGTLTLRGFAGAASTETVGSMSLTGGTSTVGLVPGASGGTAALTVAGNLTMDPRSAMVISATSTVLGATGQLKVGGTVPAASGGIIPRVANSTDFVFYDAANGFSPLPAASYSPTLAAGANVALAASTATAGSVSINALKTTAAATTTVTAGDTLTVATGMVLSASGTHTIAGPGTLAFGATPGVFFGTNTVNAPVTGSQGLLAASGTLTLAGDLSGLTGTVSNIGAGTLNLNTGTLPAASTIEVRRGTLSIGVNNLPGTGPIVAGVPANDTNLLPVNPSLSISAAGANAVISRPLVIDNGATNAAGLSLNRFGFVVGLSPLSNSTGSQTLAGNITLNTSLNLQGGGGSGTGATILSGNVSGPGTFILANGRANFTGDISNAGGLLIAFGGFTAIANFQGTITGGVPIVMNAGSTNTTGFSYSTQANLGTSPVTIQNSSGVTAPSIFALATGSINNPITLNGDVTGNAATGVTATWAGPVTGTGGVFKNGAGTLVLPNTSYTGNTTVTAGTLKYTGTASLAGSPTITVGTTATAGPILDVSGLTGGPSFSPQLGGSFGLASGQTLKGFGLVSGRTAALAGSTVAPGGSIGTLSFDSSLLLAGTYQAETAATGTQLADQILLTGGNLTIDPLATLTLSATNTYDNVTPLTIASVTGGGTLSGTFGTVTGLPSNYAVQYLPTSVVLAPVPEPGTLLLTAAGGLGLAWRWRRRKSGR